MSGPIRRAQGEVDHRRPSLALGDGMCRLHRCEQATRVVRTDLEAEPFTLIDAGVARGIGDGLLVDQLRIGDLRWSRRISKRSPKSQLAISR